jgi:hypothetical protein
VSHEELNVLKEKRAGFGLGAHRILTRVTQEKEGKADHVSNSTVGDGWSSPCQAEATHHNGERNWFNASWGRVGLGIARQLALEANSMEPETVRRGSWVPIRAKPWPTERTASSTVRDRTCLWLGARRPSR